MKTILSGLASFALLASGAAPAQQATAPTANSKAKSPNDPNRVICRTEEVTGSRLGSKKTCLTAAQWRQQGVESGQWLERQTSSMGRNGGG